MASNTHLLNSLKISRFQLKIIRRNDEPFTPILKQLLSRQKQPLRGEIVYIWPNFYLMIWSSCD